MSSPGQLTNYDAACRAVAEAHRIDEVKDIRDKAAALAVYARQARDGELIAHATGIRKRAERRLGELMEDDRKAGKLAKGTRGSPVKGARVASGPTLADQGVDKHLADRARKAAAMPEAKFEEQVARAVKVAVAATEGDAAVVREARKAEQDVKRNRRAMREGELGAKILALPDKRYGVIVADPEWRIRTVVARDRDGSRCRKPLSDQCSRSDQGARRRSRSWLTMPSCFFGPRCRCCRTRLW